MKKFYIPCLSISLMLFSVTYTAEKAQLDGSTTKPMIIKFGHAITEKESYDLPQELSPKHPLHKTMVLHEQQTRSTSPERTSITPELVAYNTDLIHKRYGCKPVTSPKAPIATKSTIFITPQPVPAHTSKK